MKKLLKKTVKKMMVKKSTTQRDPKQEIFKQLVAEVAVVSFDVFDTLLCRDVSQPRDIFKIVERLADAKWQTATAFTQQRVAAEREATAGTLAAIYEKLAGVYGAEKSAWLQDCELKIERQFLRVKPVGQALYATAVAQGKTVVACSDMYLPTSFLQEILTENGYSCARVLVSGDQNASKAAGTLYDVLQQFYPGKKILHVGDNFRVDFLNARKHGLATYLVAREPLPATDNLGQSVRQALIANRAPVVDEALTAFAYDKFGPLLLDFCLWVRQHVPDGAQPLFLSRDGYVFWQAYQRLFPEAAAAYVYTSRKTAIVASFLADDTLANVLPNFGVANNFVSLTEVAHFLGLHDLALPDEPIYQLRQRGNEFLVNPEVQAAYEAQIRPALRAKAQESYALLQEYWAPFLGQKLHVLVDVGWRGNIQRALEKIFPEQQFLGLYVGNECRNLNQEGLAFDIKKDFRNYFKFLPAMGFFETICSAQSGTVKGYTKQGTQIQPVLAQLSAAEQKSFALVHKIQDVALSFVADWARYAAVLPDTLTNSVQPFVETLANPRVALLNSIRDLAHEDLGVTPLFTQANSKNPFKRWRAVKNSTWKIAALKLNFFDGNFMRWLTPYYRWRCRIGAKKGKQKQK